MEVLFTYVGQLDAAKFNTTGRMEKAGQVIGSKCQAVVRNRMDAEYGMQVMATIEDATVTIQCSLRGLEPSALHQLRDFLETVLVKLNAVDELELDAFNP